MPALYINAGARHGTDAADEHATEQRCIYGILDCINSCSCKQQGLQQWLLTRVPNQRLFPVGLLYDVVICSSLYPKHFI